MATSPAFSCVQRALTVMSVPSLLQGTSAAPGAGMNMACVGTAPSPMSGLQLQCRPCRHHQDSSSWAVGRATPWPYVSCRHTLHHGRISRLPAHSQMPQRPLNLRVPWTERDGKERPLVTATQSHSGPTRSWGVGRHERDHSIKWLIPTEIPWRILLIDYGVDNRPVSSRGGSGSPDAGQDCR